MPPVTSKIFRDCRYARQGLGLWQPVKRPNALPRALEPWLLDSRSLTAKLRDFGNGQLNVKVLRQVWERPRLSEARALKLKKPGQMCLIREVVLQGPSQIPWVYARSVFPAVSLTGSLRHLRHLDNRPLGGYLFSHPNLGRSPISIATIPENTGVPAALQQHQLLWGRRSVFSLYGRHILVSEVFLPQFVHQVSGDNCHAEHQP